MPDNFIGMTFGAYKLVSRLGQGGMGTVYRGYQASIDRSVAIKLLPPGLLNDPNFLERFAGEARALARLRHTGILPLYEYGEAHGTPYIVMPIMTGGSLAERIKTGPLSLPEVVRVLTPIAESLDFAHRHDVLHRDVKPSNILFDEDGEAVLADFGLAKIIGADGRASAGQVAGTPAYMSPEQALGGAMDGRSDLYSLGVVAYEALTGRLPFEAGNAVQLALKHVNEAPPSLRGFNPEVSAAVEEIVLRAMHKVPAERYPAPTEFLRALSNTAYLSRDFWRPGVRRARGPEAAAPLTQPRAEPLPMDRRTLEAGPADDRTRLPDMDADRDGPSASPTLPPGPE